MIFSFCRPLGALCLCILLPAALSFCGHAGSSAQSIPPARPSALRRSAPVMPFDFKANPPSAAVVANVGNQAYLHFSPLPLGRMNGALIGQASFEPLGHRCVFLAIFPGATLGGDWRTLDPVIAFVFDPAGRTLVAIPSDGNATGIEWMNAHTLRLRDSSGQHALHIGTAKPYPLPPLRMTAPNDVSEEDIISQAGNGRLLLARNAAGRYAALQVGARRYRFEGAAPDGVYALVGDYVTWADRSHSSGAPIKREGPDTLGPPTFAGSPYGDAVVPIAPLGHGVYQGSYGSGRAYFAFSYGLRRIVAATSDLVNFRYPPLPREPVYTVGDGFGSDSNGHLYFARPEDGQVLFWRSGRYVRQALHFPAGNGRSGPLHEAMQIVAAQDSLWPALRPDEDAVDAAMLEWRIYPLAQALGRSWIASYLGHLMLSDSSGNFRYGAAPRFPFAVLGRTDDGRFWGASPLVRTFARGVVSAETAGLWWTRDGSHWNSAGQLPGDPGAVGSYDNRVWVALTQPWLGRPAIALLQLGQSSAALTGGLYGGEQLFFAQLDSGFYLVWGATPGQRLDNQQGTLSAFRIDSAALANDAGGMNAFSSQFLQPATDQSLPAPRFTARVAQAIAQPTLQTLDELGAARHATLATNLAGIQADPARISVMSAGQERAYEVKYAARPYPMAVLEVAVNGDAAVVKRSLFRGQLSFESSVERWSLDASGQWRRTAIISRVTSNF